MTIAALADLRNARRLVIKVGSALLVQDGKPRAQWLATLAAEIADIRRNTEARKSQDISAGMIPAICNPWTICKASSKLQTVCHISSFGFLPEKLV